MRFLEADHNILIPINRIHEMTWVDRQHGVVSVLFQVGDSMEQAEVRLSPTQQLYLFGQKERQVKS
ncbi:MAG: hypothetical protein OEQ39_25850 [Gammaproteobacteria bacterium]|nr:hypothetical protein [Gammaproteobacteria bacterium]